MFKTFEILVLSLYKGVDDKYDCNKSRTTSYKSKTQNV